MLHVSRVQDLQDKAFASMCCAFVSFVMFMLMISTSETQVSLRESIGGEVHKKKDYLCSLLPSRSLSYSLSYVAPTWRDKTIAHTYIPPTLGFPGRPGVLHQQPQP